MTREEAIKIIESNCSCTDSKLREACAMFIPELAESEDERIRKSLVEYFSRFEAADMWDNFFSCSQIVAYLEKQKEQKPAELPKSEDYGIDGLYAAVDILQKTLGEVDGYQTDDGILEHKCAISAVKELYEQQPTEWSEEDIQKLNRITVILGEAGTTQCWWEKKRICDKEEADNLCAFLKSVFNHKARVKRGG